LHSFPTRRSSDLKLAARHVRDFVAGHGDAAGGRHIQAPEKVEQGGLAGAAGTHEGDEVALVDIQVKPLKHLDFLAAAAIGLVQAADADEALRIAASINSDHASLLLADFDLLTIPQILRTLDDHRIAGSDAREH